MLFIFLFYVKATKQVWLNPYQTEFNIKISLDNWLKGYKICSMRIVLYIFFNSVAIDILGNTQLNGCVPSNNFIKLKKTKDKHMTMTSERPGVYIVQNLLLVSVFHSNIFVIKGRILSWDFDMILHLLIRHRYIINVAS